MNFADKIKKSWWVILSFVFFLNGTGFLYIGLKHNNRNWIIEGLAYEFPWFFYFILFARYQMGIPSTLILSFASTLMIISIIRSFWVAIKLIDVYKNNEKYAIKQTNLNHRAGTQEPNNNLGVTCCICLIFIFIVFAAMAIF